jgi:poly(3-hydroxybutyrate) depolymerase
MNKNLATVVFALFTLLWLSPCQAAKIRYDLRDWGGPDIRVYASRPAGLAGDRPVVFVMHGVNRNADDYRDQWHELAMEHDFLLIVPEFSQENFPGSNGYNLGNLEDSEGNPRPRHSWSYSAIEPLFDDARRRFRMSTPRYALYGHSAGSQFVHRFIFHVPSARVSQIVSANAGWYMMPDFQVAYPYGLAGSVITPEMLTKALSLPVTVLLGELDTDPDHPNLRRAPEAMAQGAYRLARGQAFFRQAADYAGQTGVPFNWRLELVPRADHNNALMAPAAVPFLLSQP